MKKFVLLLTLITAFSTLTLANTTITSEEGTTSTLVAAPIAVSSSDSMGMMTAFMGTSDATDSSSGGSSGNVGGGEVSVSAPPITVATTVVTVITSSNVTTATPY